MMMMHLLLSVFQILLYPPISNSWLFYFQYMRVN